MKGAPETQEIGNRSCPDCYLCGTAGQLLYQGLQDRLFGAPGIWNFKYCPNPACGLAWLDPMPLAEEIWKAYGNYYTHAANRNGGPLHQAFYYARDGYLAQKFGDPAAQSFRQKLVGTLLYLFPQRRETFNLAVMELKAQPGKRLLDIGCGRGDKLELLQSLGWQAEGIELDPKAVRQARARGLQVRQGTLADQQYPNGSFHAITMTHVIEHISEPRSLLRECYRILKPGGRLFMVTPNLGSRLHRIFCQDWRGLEPPRHFWLFSSSCLRTLVQDTGFSIDSLTTRACGAQFIYLQSWRLANHLSSNGSVWERLKAGGSFWIEWAGVKFWPHSGEELVVHGKKPNCKEV
jgi:2-polyprenyl-3-methyl-5-hydroxy-6-metoxy-1,4-benzoquinol methylase